MADTIREQIIGKLTTRAAAITVAGGFLTGIGANVFRAVSELDPSSLPAVIIWPGTEQSERSYGEDIITMQVEIEAFAAHGATASSVVAEKMLGDLRQAFTSPSTFAATYETGDWTAATFESGGTLVTDTAHGLSNGDVVMLAGTTMAGGVSANTKYYVVEKTDNAFKLSIASGGTAITFGSAGVGMTYALYYGNGVLIDDITYAGGGPEYGKGTATTTGCKAIFTIKYNTLTGNPFTQA